MDEEITKLKVIILKPEVSREEVEELVEKKKAGLYGTVVKRPKKEEIKILAIDLFYEPYWIIGGSYSGEYYRKKVYEISTEKVVTEVIIGSGVFPVRTEKGTWKKIKNSMKVGEKDNKLDIPVEEHVKIDNEDEIVFNSHGKEVKFPYKINSKNIENFPNDILKSNKNSVRPSTLNEDQVVEELIKALRGKEAEEIRMIREKIVIDRLEQVYVPVYEARCVNAKNKMQLLRIDGMSSKTL